MVRARTTAATMTTLAIKFKPSNPKALNPKRRTRIPKPTSLNPKLQTLTTSIEPKVAPASKFGLTAPELLSEDVAELCLWGLGFRGFRGFRV